jgi:hypothetical protein
MIKRFSLSLVAGILLSSCNRTIEETDSEAGRSDSTHVGDLAQSPASRPARSVAATADPARQNELHAFVGRWDELEAGGLGVGELLEA